MINNKYPTIKPSLNLDFANTKSLDPRVTFRRGTPGTYYDGVTHAKAEENLLSYSEDFAESWWTATRTVLISGQSAPNGTSTAYKIQQESGQTNAGTFRLTTPLSFVDNKSYTVSIFAKAGTNRNYLILFTNLTADREMTFFDLANGVVANADERHIAKIEGVGNDWYRCSITYTPDSSETGFNTAWNVYFGDNDSSRTVTDNDGFIYVWGAQLEQRDSVTAYTATTGTPITKYQPKLMTASPDHARFDHDLFTGESKGLLIEESRTNLITYSQQIEQQTTNSGNFNLWVISQTSGQDNALLDLNAAIAPDGTLSASKFYAFASLLPPATYQQVYVTDTTPETLTFSVFAKAGQANRYLQLFSGSGDVDGNPFANFNLFNGTISRDDSSIASIEDHGNGWYRCIITFTTTSTSGFTINPVIYLIDDDNAQRGVQMTGDDYSGIYIWGAQLEEGSFVTSYIKTTGASATRSADNASITGENFSSWYRQDEGALYVDSAKGNLGTNFAGYVSLHTEDFSNSEYYWLLHNSSDQFQFLVAPAIADLTDGIDTSLDSQKACVSWADDNFYMSVNGGTIQSDTEGPAKKNLAGLRIGFSPYSNRHYLNSAIKKLAYYPQRLTNEQLQNLTK